MSVFSNNARFFCFLRKMLGNCSQRRSRYTRTCSPGNMKRSAKEAIRQTQSKGPSSTWPQSSNSGLHMSEGRPSGIEFDIQAGRLLRRFRATAGQDLSKWPRRRRVHQRPQQARADRSAPPRRGPGRMRRSPGTRARPSAHRGSNGRAVSSANTFRLRSGRGGAHRSPAKLSG